MQISNIHLRALNNVLSELAEKDSASARFSFRVGHALTLLEPHAKALGEAERAVYMNYVEKDECGEPVMVEGQPRFSDAAALEAALMELFETELDLSPAPSFKEADFEAAGVIPTGRQAAILARFVVEK